jgi:hypothetical protein
VYRHIVLSEIKEATAALPPVSYTPHENYIIILKFSVMHFHPLSSYLFLTADYNYFSRVKTTVKPLVILLNRSELVSYDTMLILTAERFFGCHVGVRQLTQ